jgi:acyl-CoA synthetase (AMP-forming)/AMP-acid ligase II
MRESNLLPELIGVAANRSPAADALTYGTNSMTYQALATDVERFASGLVGLGLGRGERVGIYLEKRFETVIASFGAPAAGGVFVPLNPLLKPDQVGYILRDCNVRVLVTSPERLASLAETLGTCPDLAHVVVSEAGRTRRCGRGRVAADDGLGDLLRAAPRPGHRAIDTDMAAILYTSGSTGGRRAWCFPTGTWWRGEERRVVSREQRATTP